MKPNHIELQNPSNGYEEEIKVGFSWTMFFFGPLVPLFRSDWKWFFIIFIYHVTSAIISYQYKMDWMDWAQFFVDIAFAFGYNRIYINEKLKKGWKPVNEESTKRLRNANYDV